MSYYKKIINNLFERLFGFNVYHSNNNNSFLNTPIGYKTIMPIEGITMNEWQNGRWIKERHDWLKS